MDTIFIPYLFFGLLAFAALVSIIKSFGDDNNERLRQRGERGQQPHYPDQGRYDEHDSYGQNRPIIIYANYPDPNIGRYDSRQGNQQPFWSKAFIFIVLIGGLIYFFSGKGGSDINKPGIVGPPEIKNDQQQGGAGRLQNLLDKKSTAIQSDKDAVISDRDVVNPHPEQWYTVVAVYSTESAAKEAMNVVAQTINLNDKTIYYAKTNLNRWMVYIPVNSEREAKAFGKEISSHFEELKSFCPEPPGVLQIS